MDTWTDRLSEYLDGDLDPATTRELESHLAQCAACRATLEELRRVVSTVRALPDHEPEIDRWSSLRSAIEARQVTPMPTRAPLAPRRRTFVISARQAAAAAVLLALGWGGSLWWARSSTTGATGATVVASDSGGSGEARDSGTIAVASRGGEDSIASPRHAPERVTTPAPRGPAVTAVRSATRRDRGTTPATFPEADYAVAVADLEQLLADARERLDTATVRVLEQSLRSVDLALRQARAALARDPNNSYLNDYLAQTMKRKLLLLRQAADIVAAT